MKVIFTSLFLAFFAFQCAAQTWASDVAPILYANCTACHHNGGSAPFSLMTYAEAYSAGLQIADAVSNKRMPPWPPDPNYKKFVHQRVLSATEVTTIQNWVNNGRPQGNATQAPAMPTYTNGSALGMVDLSVTIPTYTVGGSGDVYRNFPIPSGLIQGKYVTGIEVLPGNPSIVHHVLVFHDTTNIPAQLDANQSGPGYNNAGGTGSPASKLLAGYTPGASPYYTPVGTGFRLPAGTNIVVQVHYPAGSQGQIDNTTVNFKLSSTPVREITVWPILNHLQNINQSINIPANQTRTYSEAQTINTNYTVLSVFPHMHLIGRNIMSWANTGVGAPNDTIRFVNINDWDFHWQDTYLFPNAIKVPSGSTLRARAFYDNTTNNPDNPNSPPQTITAGEATTEEMMMVFFAYMPYVTGDENLIISRRVMPQGATTFCNGQSVVLETIEGVGYTYQWYRNGTLINGANAFNYTATQTGNYHVNISLGPNNSLSDTIGVTVSSAPSASITPVGSTTVCPNSSVTLNANTGSGLSYQWYNNGTPISGATSSSYNTNTAGSYTVEVYNGCYTTSSPLAVSNAQAPSSSVSINGNTTLCQGQSVSLSAASGLTYNWSNGATSQTINVSQAGVYKVTVTNASGCTASSNNITVSVNALPSAAISANGPLVFCQGSNVMLSAQPGLSYQWSNGSTSQNITVNQSGSYLVTVTDANSCSASSSSTSVTVNAAPNAAITPTGPIVFCDGGSVSLAANPGMNYGWSNGSNSQSVLVNATGTYIVTVTNANQCSDTASIGIVVHALPSATTTTNQPTTICPGDSVIISAGPGLNYQWNTGATTQSVTVYNNGVFSVTVTDANNCSAVSGNTTVTISNNAVAGINPSGPTTFCDGGSVTLTATQGNGYVWSNGAQSQSITVSQGGVYTVTVTVTSNCTAVSSPENIVVNINPATPSLSVSGSTSFCEGEDVVISAPAGYTYSWSNNEVDQSIQVSTSGNFAVTVTDSNGCSASSLSVATTMNPLPTVTLSGNSDTVCLNSSTFNLTGGTPPNGSYSGTLVSGSQFTPGATGSQNVTYTYTDQNGCSNSAEEVLEVVVCTGVFNHAGETSFSVHPNPTSGELRIDFEKSISAHLGIFDYTGRSVGLLSLEGMSHAIDVSHLAQGYYIFELKHDGLSRRFVIIKN